MKKTGKKEEPRTVATPPTGGGRPWGPDGRVGIEDLLIWVYRDQMAHKAGGGEMSGRAVSNAGMIAEQMRLGTVVDTSRNLGFEVHPVASIVDAWCGLFGSGDQSLLLRHAATGSRPDWCPCDRPRIGAGEPGVIRGLSGPGGRMINVPYQLVIVSNTAAEIASKRAVYSVWSRHLESLASAMAGCEHLAAHGVRVRGMARADRWPWLEVKDPATGAGYGRGVGFGEALPAHLVAGMLPPMEEAKPEVIDALTVKPRVRPSKAKARKRRKGGRSLAVKSAKVGA